MKRRNLFKGMFGLCLLPLARFIPKTPPKLSRPQLTHNHIPEEMRQAAIRTMMEIIQKSDEDLKRTTGLFDKGILG